MLMGSGSQERPQSLSGLSKSTLTASLPRTAREPHGEGLEPALRQPVWAADMCDTVLPEPLLTPQAQTSDPGLEDRKHLRALLVLHINSASWTQPKTSSP
jgi:hypothetical protein